MNLIALDIATTTGFCSHDCSGSINLGECGNKYQNIYDFLWDLNAAYSPHIIAVERAAGQHKNALIVMSRIRGVVELFCAQKGIEIVEYSPMTIKKDFVGSGRADKQSMINKFFEINGYMPVDDNQADAFALYALAKKDLKL